MAGFIVKIIICPIAILFASWILPNVNFSSWYQPIILGVVIALVGYFMEVLMLRRDTNWLATLLDFLVASAIVYFGSLIFINSYVSFWGAVFTGLIVAITEVFQHYWLLRSDRAGDEDPVTD
ncbi:DUF2512 family protein [Virgibacillus sp. 179-BFC.A HS]|uniref:DUF2512 family protein n=1 Tax=Tigheibacillus jepli TaxID=3035914 RepID=A0ABU5CHA6_9BACI|nr:DUF2512 family protein [Virgibacillus sp. 179-BFC.A HS]MDY0405742.1 DUF2512 family protein [Virgibacillus sp. 179-BFC.A HS]